MPSNSNNSIPPPSHQLPQDDSSLLSTPLFTSRTPSPLPPPITLSDTNSDNCPIINNSYSHPDNHSSNIPPVSREIPSNSQATCLPFDLHASLTPSTPTCHLTSPPLQPVQTNNQDNSPSLLVHVRAKSCSRRNFAANLNRLWYSEEERKKCNVNGKSNKKQLSPKRMGKIFSAVFQMYPKTQKETEKEAWADCVKAIDVANRALNRKRGKEN